MLFKRFLLFSSLISLVFIIYLIRPNYSDRVKGQYYIAHAGGEIDGYAYTNSKEAVENAIKNGINYIELDLSLTSDSILVCAHDWKAFNIQTGVSEDSVAISFEEFKKRKIYSRFSPLSIYELDSILLSNPGLFLVTDKISDPIVINKWLSKYKNRLVIECFTYEDYVNLYKTGYYLPMFSHTPDLRLLLMQRLHKLFKDHSFVICNFYASYKPHYIKKKNSFKNLLELQKTSYSIFWTNTKEEADSIFKDNPHVHFVYIDKVN